MSLLTGVGTGCSLDGILKNDEVPANVTNPAITKTRNGALAVYGGLRALFVHAYDGSVRYTGLLSDELRSANYTRTFDVRGTDARTVPEDGSDASDGFAAPQQVRAQAGQAIGLLTAYASDEPALLGHAYALEGYAELFLAELFCSGVPLSTLDFGGHLTYRPGSSTQDVFQHATALFDTASKLVGDSVRFVHLAAVGKGRALLAMGDYAGAAAAVAAVPDDYRYGVNYSAAVITSTDGTTTRDARNFFYFDNQKPWPYSVANREGGNGLDYRTSGDPRSRATLGGTDSTGLPVYVPAQYGADGSSPIVLASGVEARLIAAEAALQANAPDGQWLTILNALRTNGTFETRPTTDQTDDPAATYPHWHAGIGGVDSLAPLEDPGAMLSGPAADAARVDLLFRERALWLFLTGHRQGDLRRLIRQYGRRQDDIYPIGPYPGATAGERYGIDVMVPIPKAERVVNPLFHGCLPSEA